MRDFTSDQDFISDKDFTSDKDFKDLKNFFTAKKKDKKDRINETAVNICFVFIKFYKCYFISITASYFICFRIKHVIFMIRKSVVVKISTRLLLKNVDNHFDWMWCYRILLILLYEIY